MATKKKYFKINCPSCNTSEIRKKFLGESFSVYFCRECLNGFTNPRPKNILMYYHQYYWIPPGLVGTIKNNLFSFFQKRRKGWLLRYLKKGGILEIGPGEGLFIKSLPQSFLAKGLEPRGSKIQNKQIIKADFLGWKTKEKFDAVIFWESLEHVPSPREYIKKVSKILKPNGYIFIEYPRFDCLEAKLFGQFWFHLDLPRHISHLTQKGLFKMLKDDNFTIQQSRNIAAFEYSVVGFLLSAIKPLGINLTDKLKQPQGALYLIVLLPLLFAAGVIELILYSLDQSPIGLIVARKNQKIARSNLLRR